MAMVKVVIFGEGGVGKSAITIQLTQNYFVVDYDPTIENSYRKQILIDSVPYMIDILDTAGQEEYSAMKEQYIRTGQGFIIVFSIGSRYSFDSIGDHYRKILQVKDVDQFPIILCANKSDLPLEEREVTIEEAKKLADELGIKIIQTSAKTRTNIELAFETIVREIIAYQKDGRERSKDIQDPANRKRSNSTIKLNTFIKNGCVLI